MENLLVSRSIREEIPSKLQNLSPQKYGRAAFANLTYTPSKLADNVLFKDLTTQKKIQQGSSKLRQTQALNSLFQDRLSQLQQQRDGIQRTLTQQILMYKKMLKDNEQKNERRIRNLQQNFNQEMQRVLQEKQQEAKYAQSEKELFENRIFQLQQMVNQLKGQLSNLDSNYLESKNENQKLNLMNDSLNKRLEDVENRVTKDNEKNKMQIQELKRQIYNNDVQAKSKLEKALHEKDKQMENLERLHRNQLEKIQNKRAQQTLLKNQQIKDLSATFEKEMSRLNGVISKKEDLIDQLNKAVELEKQKYFAGSKGYQNEITNLANQKTRLKEELIKSDRKVQKLTTEVQQLQDKLASQISVSSSKISQLKKDLELTQINYMREADKNAFTLQDMDKQIIRLRIDNEKTTILSTQNTALHRELRNMKELLMQSSVEMQRCKDEFIRLGRQKDLLLIKLREMGIENDTLYRIKNEREEEARGWRESYLIQKSHY